MDTETPTLIAVLRDRMEKMKPHERLELMDSLMQGYCRECEFDDPDHRCQCWNDE